MSFVNRPAPVFQSAIGNWRSTIRLDLHRRPHTIRAVGESQSPLSSSGLGHLVLSQRTGVRLPLGVLKKPGTFRAFSLRPPHLVDLQLIVATPRHNILLNRSLTWLISDYTSSRDPKAIMRSGDRIPNAQVWWHLHRQRPSQRQDNSIPAPHLMSSGFATLRRANPTSGGRLDSKLDLSWCEISRASSLKLPPSANW
jgi:hypothetical protein